jgi:hypothetical protein
LRAVLLAAFLLIGAQATAQTEAVLDTATLPSMRPPGPEIYRDRFITGNLPRAWAIATNGASGGAWGGRDAAAARDAALKTCADRGGTDCALYAVDLDVVWHGRQPAPRTAQPALITAPGYSFTPDPRFFWFGPERARGVVVWGHGFGGPNDDERGRQPPSFLRPLNNAGFDIVRFDRDPGWDQDIEKVVGWLRDGLAELRRRGWRVAVSGGQSRGGWNNLELLRTPGFADIVITTSAAASGTNPGTQILRGETMLYTVLDAVPAQRTRVAYVQFRDDPFGGDEDRRAERVRQMLGPKVGPLLLIDRPEGFAGHSAAYQATFGERFGACIARFVLDPVPPGACP